MRFAYRTCVMAFRGLLCSAFAEDVTVKSFVPFFKRGEVKGAQPLSLTAVGEIFCRRFSELQYCSCGFFFALFSVKEKAAASPVLSFGLLSGIHPLQYPVSFSPPCGNVWGQIIKKSAARFCTKNGGGSDILPRRSGAPGGCYLIHRIYKVKKSVLF